MRASSRSEVGIEILPRLSPSPKSVKIDLRSGGPVLSKKPRVRSSKQRAVKSASQGTSRLDDKDGCGPVVGGGVVECLGVIVSAVPYVLHPSILRHRVGLGGLNLSFAIG